MKPPSSRPPHPPISFRCALLGFMMVLFCARYCSGQIPTGDPVTNVWPTASTTIDPVLFVGGTFDALPASTLYHYYDHAFCSANGFSAWSGTQFTTLQTFPYTYATPLSPRT